MKKIVLTGGGTAGHVMPHLAIAPYLTKAGYKMFYIGSNGIEKEIIEKNLKIPYSEIPSAKLKRSMSLSNFALPFKLCKGIFAARKELKKINPDVVFSKGGYVAVPVVIAAWMLKIPVVSHESDFSFGLANRLCMMFSKCMCTSFAETSFKNKKAIHTGSPVRDVLFQGNAESALKECNFKEKKKTVLVFGGSLGAKAINDTVLDCLPKLTKTYNIIHIVGKGNLTENNLKDSCYQIEFTNNIENFFAAADYVISRSGSNSIFELLALKKPMLLIPLPKGGSRGDQIENANEFEKRNYAIVLKQENLTSKTLMETLKKLERNAEKMIKEMQKENNFDGNISILEQIELHSKPKEIEDQKEIKQKSKESEEVKEIKQKPKQQSKKKPSEKTIKKEN